MHNVPYSSADNTVSLITSFLMNLLCATKTHKEISSIWCQTHAVQKLLCHMFLQAIVGFCRIKMCMTSTLVFLEAFLLSGDKLIKVSYVSQTLSKVS